MLGLQPRNEFEIKLGRKQIKLIPLGAAEEHKVAEVPVQSSSQDTFLPRDPQWAAVFWEISRADQGRSAAAVGQQLCLRLADVTGLSLGAAHLHTLQEVVMQTSATEWYRSVPLCDRD
ncbi:MAG: DUF4912 domain-containing protein [Cyanobacteriota bacterium]|nr:DUF4912 domain-containing protein [Cyanobacteriota bacterium]